MKAASGEYLNLYSEIGHENAADLETDKLDIFILFAEVYSGSLDMTAMESRAIAAIKKWKDRYYVPKRGTDDTALRFVGEKVRKVLEEEFEEEAALILVREIA